jgi:hypothetical protein
VVFGTTAIVTGYKLTMVLVANGLPVKTYDLGKPTPKLGIISISTTMLVDLPAGIYVGEAYPYGPGGEGKPRLRAPEQVLQINAPRPAVAPASFH